GRTDNGLQYGARLRLRTGKVASGATNNGVDYDKAFIFAEGSFGRVEFGSQTGPSDLQRFGVLDWGTGASTDGDLPGYIN
ncbi:porin, partial [Acinetobacter baumannii]